MTVFFFLYKGSKLKKRSKCSISPCVVQSVSSSQNVNWTCLLLNCFVCRNVHTKHIWWSVSPFPAFNILELNVQLLRLDAVLGNIIWGWVIKYESVKILLWRNVNKEKKMNSCLRKFIVTEQKNSKSVTPSNFVW